MARLKEMYKKDVVPAMMERFNYANVNQVPKLEKVVLNMGLGEAKENARVIDSALEEMATIAGQKAVVTKARKSVANFKVREGMNVGIKTTLRGQKMYEYVDKLVTIALPRVRDFRGVPNKSFDGRGNYSMGIKEQLIYPEISYDKVDAIRGMDIAFVTTANTDEEAHALLELLGMPFSRED